MGITLFQSVTLAIAFELFAIWKALQQNDHAYLASCIAAVVGINYGLLIFYNLAIYPVFVDPLRNVPGPRVYILPVQCLILLTDYPSTEMC